MANKTILIVDDDPVQRRILQSVCDKMGHKTLQAKNGIEALELTAKYSQYISLILLDLNMPGDLSGQDVLKKLNFDFANIPVIVITATSSVNIIVECMQLGACDFFVKPAAVERIIVSINNALNATTLKKEVTRLTDHSNGSVGFDELIGDADSIQLPIKMGKKAARSNIPVLITGESGVGKEIFAKAIQNASERSGRPFITVNCGALPANLVESVLFGHEKGSFTGATTKHFGKFQEANGGTIFLDEVGELPLDTQVKLLRTLQEGEVDPIGSKSTVKIDTRVISATNRDLEEDVKSGSFREDLFYRLNVFPIELPPLRQRTQDIEKLVSFFIDRYNARENKNVTSIAPKALKQICLYPWPGNIRQLENMIFRAVILCNENVLDIDDFPNICEQKVTGKIDTPLKTNNNLVKNNELAVKLIDADGQIKALKDIEIQIIHKTVALCDGNISKAASKLGLKESSIQEGLKKLLGKTKSGLKSDPQKYG